MTSSGADNMKTGVNQSILTLLFSLLLCPSALAGPLWIVGLGGGVHHNEAGNDSVNPVNIHLSLALAVSDHVEIGAEVTTTLAEDDIGSSDFEVDTTFVFIRGVLSLGGDTEVYAQVGNSSIELTETSDVAVSNRDDTDTGIGFGARFTLGSESAWSIEYMRYFDNDELDNVAGDVSHSSISIDYLIYF